MMNCLRPFAGSWDCPTALDLTSTRAAIVGLPFDMGVAPVRVGSRMGPDAIRDQSEQLEFFDPYQPDLDLREALGLVDCGNAVVWPAERERSFDNIQAAISCIDAAGAVPVSFGGDGSVSLPQLRALSPRHDGLVLVHWDAHTDAYPAPYQGVHTTGTTFTYAASEGLVDTEKSFHVGARGPISNPQVFGHTTSLGYRLISDRDMRARGFEDVLAELKSVIGSQPVYLCWDMDFYDPSCAPAVCNPVWGGISAPEGFEIIQGMSGLNVVGVDINTVSPPHDVNGMTAHLAGRTVLEMLVPAGAERSRTLVRPTSPI